MVDPARLTPEEAKVASDADLTQWANRYRSGSGAHTVVVAEIHRRSERRKGTRKVIIAVIVGAIGLVFYALRHLLF